MPGDFDPRDSADPRDHDNVDIYDARWLDDSCDRDLEVERDRDSRDHDPRDAFVEGLELPRGLERELVQDDRENLYELNREDSLALATIGAFRVVAERDLETVHDRNSESRHDILEHLRDEGLIRFVAINEDERAAVLTEDGRDLLESNRRERGEDDQRQAFHAGVSHPRELQHDSTLADLYLERYVKLRGLRSADEIERLAVLK